jgi:hypothetical protein
MTPKIIALLTKPVSGLILIAPFAKSERGICTPDNQGPKRPLSHVVFLCPSKTQAALCRLDSVMAGCIGQPLKRLTGSLAGSANPIQSAARRFAPKGGGLFPLSRKTAMTSLTQKPAASSQAPAGNGYQSLFNLIKHTPEGKKLICHDLTFEQAVSLINEIPLSLTLKFSKMEALS